jgi:RNA polymerase sigma-70 factor (ECF subfamily)
MEPPDSARPDDFATTRWSIVLQAGDRASPESQRALQTLCEAYWYPLYAYARRRGSGPDESADLTQEFFARLLERPVLQTADRERGRFRAFLLTVFKRFLSNEAERHGAQKRGAGRLPLSIDAARGEERYRFEPADPWTPERLYERRWALTLLDRVMQRLGDEYQGRGKAELFERCKPALTGADTAAPYADVARQLGMAETAVRVAVHRMRQRYRELLTEEVRQTVDTPAEVDEELRSLRRALRGENA